MAAMRIRVVNDDDRTPEQIGVDWLLQAKDEYLACRGQGHNWPKLRPGKPQRGIRHHRPPELEGCVEISFTCRDCGMVRRLITQPDGMIDLPAIYHYEQPPGYKAPKGSKVTRRQAFAESNRRWIEDMQARYGGVPPINQGREAG